MDKLPPEVLRIICTYLGFRDAANVRFLTHSLAIVAAEFLITRVCFHTSTASLERLEKIANHPVFSRTVKALEYEAALLADVRCRHEYARHFEHDHHGLERPKDPPAMCSARERRLHIRNKRKWIQNIYAKYDAYRSHFDAQQSLLTNNTVEQVLSRCIPKFPKLAYMDIDPVRRCTHMTSSRFIEEFGTDCASPLSGNFGKISDQFRWMLLPENYIINSLRKLEINSLSPQFFSIDHRSSLQAAFKSLTDIDIVLKLADGDVGIGEQHKDSFRRHLSNGVFVEVLSAATKLEYLSIGIDSTLPLFVDVAALLSNTSWTQLKSLGLSTVSSTQMEFMELLKRQPKLKSLHVALMQLTHGNWPDTLLQMRDQLDLNTFLPIGFLEDSNETWPMDLIDVPTYIESHEESDLGNAINLYVTEFDEYLVKEIGPLKNPLTEAFSQFEDPDVVREMYGSFSDLEDEMSVDEFSDEEMSEDGSQVSMTDLLDWDEDRP